jgi:aryl-alcohol dehydrogenase-like predicted oxidoreductase
MTAQGATAEPAAVTLTASTVSGARGRISVLAVVIRMKGQPTATTPSALTGCLLTRQNVLLIPGTSNTTHLAENVAAANVRLDPDTIETLDGLADNPLARRTRPDTPDHHDQRAQHP